MELIVAGGRKFNDYKTLSDKLDYLLSRRSKAEVVFICGMALGADSLGRRYAKENGYSWEEYPASWDLYGRSAGPIRNSQMADVGTHLVCFWDGISKGTKNMINTANKKGLVVKIVYY